MRHRKNRHGLTAYGEAANDKIRQLFLRPTSSRFCDDSADDNGDFFSFTTDQPSGDDENDDEAPDDCVEGVADEVEVKLQKSLMQISKVMVSTQLLRSIMMRKVRNRDRPEGKNADDEAIDELHELIDNCVTDSHSKYGKACELLSKYRSTKKPEHLLRLYPLETPFYRSLVTGDENLYLVYLLLARLGSLKARAFHGRTYRGLSMTTTDLKPYKQAARKKGSIIYTNSLCSTSIDEVVAEGFMSTSAGEKLNVLMIFDFPQPCDMAIQLYALSDAVPCMSDFENEREVLVLPKTMFHVISISNHDRNGQCTIYLENVLQKLELRALWDKGREKLSKSQRTE